jgi:recombination protein RecR
MAELFSPLIEELIEAFRALPSIGRKSAQRMAFHLLERDRAAGKRLAEALSASMDKIGHCELCQILTEKALCDVCSSEKRDKETLCIVEMPMDVLSLEQTGAYRGLYFVLMGHLSPLDGIGPEELKLDILEARLGSESIHEIILATSSTAEGQATAYYISRLAERHAIPCFRIAQGIPIGGELEYMDPTTLTHALTERKKVV